MSLDALKWVPLGAILLGPCWLPILARRCRFRRRGYALSCARYRARRCGTEATIHLNWTRWDNSGKSALVTNGPRHFRRLEGDVESTGCIAVMASGHRTG